MKPQTYFSDWVKKLKAEGKSDEEVGKLLAGVAKLSALETYEAIMSVLTEEDMKAVEAIADDEQAKVKMEELFKLRAGVSTAEFVATIADNFARGYDAG